MKGDWMNEAIEQATIHLTKWKKGRVQIWDYTPTHSKLTLRVESREIPGNLHIICGELVYFRGYSRWNNCDFEATRVVKDGLPFLMLLDRQHEFELHCKVISTVENVEPIYTPNLGQLNAEKG